MEPLPKKLAPPIRNERKPHTPIPWRLPPHATRHKVKDRENWHSVAKDFGVKDAEYLVFYNFHTHLAGRGRNRQGATDEVNWYLRNYVGCRVSTDGGRNWAFSNSAEPGIIFIPPRNVSFEGDGLITSGRRGVGGVVDVPEYDDSNFLDALSKALDIYQIIDLGLSTSGAALPVLAEAGMIAIGALTGLVGPAIAIGAPHADALRYLSRGHFFEGFSFGLVMAANGASNAYIRDRHELKYPPLNAVYPEKRETFRQLHNMGLALGINKGRKFNLIDQETFFTYLHTRMNAADQFYFSPKTPWRDWSEQKRKSYYDLLAGMVRRAMLDNDLKLNFKFKP